MNCTFSNIFPDNTFTSQAVSSSEVALRHGNCVLLLQQTPCNKRATCKRVRQPTGQYRSSSESGGLCAAPLQSSNRKTYERPTYLINRATSQPYYIPSQSSIFNSPLLTFPPVPLTLLHSTSPLIIPPLPLPLLHSTPPSPSLLSLSPYSTLLTPHHPFSPPHHPFSPPHHPSSPFPLTPLYSPLAIPSLPLTIPPLPLPLLNSPPPPRHPSSPSHLL
ncbi:hypothetical protein Pcinc_035830 [Petrolisthes cinctipes]|uniref:Uncharacterized protein n=1 Tax=Petrolisthes cinctipes TaxID=88211 RepID=A0AAE1BW63_PETCI|nr:hypothetical protein Pcinc_035830 [Petrolisthes cinctipes]